MRTRYGQIRERNKESTVGNHRHLPYFISTCRRTFVFTCKGLPHEMLLHDYGVSGYQLNHEDKFADFSFYCSPQRKRYRTRQRSAGSIGYSEATSMQLLPTVREYRNQTMLYLLLLLLFLFGMVYLVLLFYLRRSIELLMMREVRFENFWMAILCPELNVPKPVIGIAFSMMSMKWRLFSPPMQRARSRQRSSYRTSFRMYHIRLKRRYLL